MNNPVIVGDNSKVLIDNRVWTFGSVAGYAARNYLQQAENYHQSTRNYTQGWSLLYHIENEVKRAKSHHHELVWLNPDATVIMSEQYVELRARQAKLRETIPRLNIGDFVLLEGDVYELVWGNHSDHIKLVYVSTPQPLVSAKSREDYVTNDGSLIEVISNMMVSLYDSPKSLLRGIQDLIELSREQTIRFDEGTTPWWRR